MDQMLCLHTVYAATYLDHVITHSETWAAHVQWAASVLESLRQVGVTANQKKCTVGRREI